MNIHSFKIPRGLAAMAVGFSFFATGIAFAQEPEILTRGPVHEAFAGTIEFDPEVGSSVSKAPPELINEVPPDQRPEGDNVTWIPGYWAWDDDQNDFLWISGIWRSLPPGREWVPGYWAENGAEYQWTSGYWEDEEATEVSYLPEPPKSQERGPNVEAPSKNHAWVPGNWVWQDDDYAWRAGYWAQGREDWSWTPAYYRWTPRGYNYVDGYWDYPVERRGVVFAPVRFERDYYSRPDYSYSPVTAIAVSVFVNHLFLRPSHNHYYFGDYYEPRYRERGYFASYDYYSNRRGFDPIYSRYRWENRENRDWDRGRREYFEYRRDHNDSRPPRTWRELSSRSASDRERGDFGVAQRFDRYAENRGNGRQKFQKVSNDDRQRFVSQRQEIRKFGKDRAQMESRRDSSPGAGKERKAVREKINKSPVLANKSNKADRAPERLQARAKDRDPSAQKRGKDGDDKNPGKKDNGMPKRENANRGENDKNDRKVDKPDTEKRTTPGQKREKNPDANPGGEGNRDAEPNKKNDGPGKKDSAPNRNNNEGKKNAGTNGNGDGKKKEQADAPKRQQEQPKRQAEQPKREANPTPKKQTAEPKRQANPSPKKQQPDAQPKRQAEQPKRDAQPTPKKKENNEGKKNNEQSKRSEQPSRQANVAPVKNQNAQPQRKAQAAPKRQAQAEPKRQAQNQPKAQATPQRKASNSEGKKKSRDKDKE